MITHSQLIIDCCGQQAARKSPNNIATTERSVLRLLAKAILKIKLTTMLTNFLKLVMSLCLNFVCSQKNCGIMTKEAFITSSE